MAWIKTIEYKKATDLLKRIYDRVKGPDNQIDNILLVHSLRPHTLTGHMSLYKNVLHHKGNSLPKWYLETVGVYVSLLNHCNYCVDHHFAGLKRLLNDEDFAQKIWNACESSDFEGILDKEYCLGLIYAEKLTLHPESFKENDISILRLSGLTDGQILEINQVTAYFNYANRTVLGLGVTTDGEVLGLSPGDAGNTENWKHD